MCQNGIKINFVLSFNTEPYCGTSLVWFSSIQSVVWVVWRSTRITPVWAATLYGLATSKTPTRWDSNGDLLKLIIICYHAHTLLWFVQIHIIALSKSCRLREIVWLAVVTAAATISVLTYHRTFLVPANAWKHVEHGNTWNNKATVLDVFFVWNSTKCIWTANTITKGVLLCRVTLFCTIIRIMTVYIAVCGCFPFLPISLATVIKLSILCIFSQSIYTHYLHHGKYTYRKQH